MLVSGYLLAGVAICVFVYLPDSSPASKSYWSMKTIGFFTPHLLSVRAWVVAAATASLRESNGPHSQLHSQEYE